METLSLGMALFSGKARIGARLLDEDRMAAPRGRVASSLRRWRSRDILPPALLAVPLTILVLAGLGA
ncbi:MAG TPA: hypothetical protein PKA74_05785 [Bauldia sp.]|nr:hypothetical protein [Bauldia sp.]